MREIREVLRLYFAVALSIRAIARSLGTSRSTQIGHLMSSGGINRVPPTDSRDRLVAELAGV